MRLTLATLALLLCLVLLLAGAARAQEDEEPTIREDYQVTINDVGDGHITDTIEYSKDDYAAVKKAANENEGFLTRRFTTDDNTGEVLHFKTDMQDAENSVVITYDKPGYVYSQNDEFTIYGFSKEPKKDEEGAYVYEEKSTINSEFTLFTDQVIQTKTSILLPEAARQTHYEADEEALKYQMPAAGTLLGFWSENKTIMSIVLSLCTLLFAGLLLLVATRKTVPVKEPTVSVPGPVAPSAGMEPTVSAPGPVAPPAGMEPAGAPTQAEAGELQASGTQPAGAAAEKAAHKFCSKCGHPLTPGKSFCTNCGKHV